MTVTQTIKNKAYEGKQLTPRQKLAVLTETRALIGDKEDWIAEDYHDVIDGVEKFCLYGALHCVTGLGEFGGDEADDRVSDCSLTRTMFEALPDTNKWKAEALAKIERDRTRRFHPSPESRMVNALQGVNDNQGHAAALRVLDRAIASLEEQING